VSIITAHGGAPHQHHVPAVVEEIPNSLSYQMDPSLPDCVNATAYIGPGISP